MPCLCLPLSITSGCIALCVFPCVTLYPWRSPFWVSRGGVSQVTSRMEGDTAVTLIDWGATDGAAKEEDFCLNSFWVCVCVCIHTWPSVRIGSSRGMFFPIQIGLRQYCVILLYHTYAWTLSSTHLRLEKRPYHPLSSSPSCLYCLPLLLALLILTSSFACEMYGLTTNPCTCTLHPPLEYEWIFGLRKCKNFHMDMGPTIMSKYIHRFACLCVSDWL